MTAELHRQTVKVSLKMNVKKTKVPFHNHLMGQPVMIGNETLMIAGKQSYLEQTLSAIPHHEEGLRKRTGIEWNAFGKHNTTMNSILPLSPKEKGVQLVHPASPSLWFRERDLTKDLEGN